VPDLSDVIKSDWQQLGYLERESKALREKFRITLPFYLTLIKHTQPANYDRLIPRLLRLNLHVVKELSTTEWLKPLPEVRPLTSKVKVHLDQGEVTNPGVGRRLVIAGDLYVSKDAADNLDLLGDYIADYIEIARLADAFVILINRPAEQAKWRFLKSKGVSEETLAEVLADIQVRRASDEENRLDELAIADLVTRVSGDRGSTQVKPTSVGPGHATGRVDYKSDDEKDSKEIEQEPVEPIALQYPQLDFSDLPGTALATSLEAAGLGEGSGKKGGNGGSGTGYPPRQEVTEALGERGERWAYANEKLRLQVEYGFDPAELEELEELVWVSQRKPTANYDIKSIWQTESGEQRSLYIEVKATAGDNRRIRMGKQEFRLAMSMGEDYWLCWVANVDEARPEAPVCYTNIAQLIAEGKLVIDVDTLALTLPDAKGVSHVESEEEFIVH
jgi:hypothetical protein